MGSALDLAQAVFGREGTQNAAHVRGLIRQGVWTHPDCPGFQLQLFALDPATRRELWHRYAEQQQAPKPEEFR